MNLENLLKSKLQNKLSEQFFSISESLLMPKSTVNTLQQRRQSKTQQIQKLQQSLTKTQKNPDPNKIDIVRKKIALAQAELANMNESVKPIEANPESFLYYFQDLSVQEIQNQLKTAKNRWVTLQKNPNSDPKEFKLLSVEINAGQKVLQQKLKKHQEFLKKKEKDQETVHKVLSGLAGGSPLASMVSKHVTNHLFKNE